MGRDATLLAFDPGASSGRAVVGRLRGGRISLTIPDLLDFWLVGTAVREYTNVTTTQVLDRGSSWEKETLCASRGPGSHLS
jgi:sugar (pentulose or hexulose) kinase